MGSVARGSQIKVSADHTSGQAVLASSLCSLCPLQALANTRYSVIGKLASWLSRVRAKKGQGAVPYLLQIAAFESVAPSLWFAGVVFSCCAFQTSENKNTSPSIRFFGCIADSSRQY